MNKKGLLAVTASTIIREAYPINVKALKKYLRTRNVHKFVCFKHWNFLHQSTSV